MTLMLASMLALVGPVTLVDDATGEVKGESLSSGADPASPTDPASLADSWRAWGSVMNAGR